MGGTNSTGEEKRRHPPHVRRLSSPQQCFGNGCIPDASHRRSHRQGWKGQVHHHSRFITGLLASSRPRRRLTQDGIYYSIRSLPVQDHAIWTPGCPCNILANDGRSTRWPRFRRSLPRRRPHTQSNVGQSPRPYFLHPTTSS